MGWTKRANLRGPRGHGVKDARIDDTGHLIIQRTDAPALDAGEVRGAQGLPGMNAVPTDAGVAGYIGTAGTSQSKTAVKGVIQDAMAPVMILATDYGAVGNPATDNGPAIQAALDAAATLGGGRVVLPPGDYGLGTTIRLREGVAFHGYGATLHRLAGLGMMAVNWAAGDTTTGAYDGRSDIELAGMTWDGHGDTVTATLNTVTFDHCRNITVRDVRFLRSRGYHALELNSVDGALVDSCRFEGFVAVAGLTEKEAIQIDCAMTGAVDSGLTDGTMARNITVRDCTFTGWELLPAHQVAVGSHSQIGAGFYDNIRVRGCTIDATALGVAAFYWRDSVIESCSIRIGAGAIGVRSIQGVGVTVNAVTVRGTGATQGISHTASSVRGRTIGCTVEGVNEGFYIGVGSDGCVVESSTSRNTISYGISVNGAKSTLITGCVIIGAGYQAGAFGAIRVSQAGGPTDLTSIIGCKAVAHGAGIEATYGVSVAAGTPGTWLSGNDFTALSAPYGGPVRRSPEVYAGVSSITPSAPNTPTSVNVTLPPGMFQTAPSVTVTAESSVPGTQITGVGVVVNSTTSFTLWLTRTNTNLSGVLWIAAERG